MRTGEPSAGRPYAPASCSTIFIFLAVAAAELGPLDSEDFREDWVMEQAAELEWSALVVELVLGPAVWVWAPGEGLVAASWLVPPDKCHHTYDARDEQYSGKRIQ